MGGIFFLIYLVGFFYTLRWLLGWAIHYDYRGALSDFDYRYNLGERHVRNWTMVVFGVIFWPFTLMGRFGFWVFHFNLSKRLVRHAFVKTPKKS